MEHHNNTHFAAIKRLNFYLKEKGVSVNGVKLPVLIRKYCELENLECNVSLRDFLISEFRRSDSRISKKVKIPNTKKVFSQKKLTYKAYIKSAQWINFRNKIRKERGEQCENCGVKDVELHGHHLTYERFTNELPSDILIVCKVCHKKIHAKKSLPTQKNNLRLQPQVTIKKS